MLDMDSRVSPTDGEQELSVWNGDYECTCYHPLFVFNAILKVDTSTFALRSFDRPRIPDLALTALRGSSVKRT